MICMMAIVFGSRQLLCAPSLAQSATDGMAGCDAALPASNRRVAPRSMSVACIQPLIGRVCHREGVLNLRRYLSHAAHTTSWKTAPQPDVLSRYREPQSTAPLTQFQPLPTSAGHSTARLEHPALAASSPESGEGQLAAVRVGLWRLRALGLHLREPCNDDGQRGGAGSHNTVASMTFTLAHVERLASMLRDFICACRSLAARAARRGQIPSGHRNRDAASKSE